MPIFPLQVFLRPLSENPWTYLVFGLIGFAFGFVLEISGFGNSKKLAAQFYFKDLTVLKVMFTAIVVAMVLIFLASGLGLLDYNQIWVNPTYFWPGIIGGLIMGVGFIVGGFCPGTSVVSAATFKIDGLFFLLGSLFGVWAFSETVDYYTAWWNGSYYGRITLMDFLNLPTGLVVVLVVLMALFMFWGGEQLERIFGKRDLGREPKLRIAGAAGLLIMALAVWIVGQPTTNDKWVRIASVKNAALTNRSVQIHPAELLASLSDQKLNVVMLDVRDDADYNLFHLSGVRHVPLVDIRSVIPELLELSASNLVVVSMSNDEAAATEAWKILVAESVPNVYILEGGVNNWITVFGKDEKEIVPTPAPVGNDRLRYTFQAALGDRYQAARPNSHEWEFQFTPKIQLQLKRGLSGGGCG